MCVCARAFARRTCWLACGSFFGSPMFSLFLLSLSFPFPSVLSAPILLPPVLPSCCTTALTLHHSSHQTYLLTSSSPKTLHALLVLSSSRLLISPPLANLSFSSSVSSPLVPLTYFSSSYLPLPLLPDLFYTLPLLVGLLLLYFSPFGFSISALHHISAYCFHCTILLFSSPSFSSLTLLFRFLFCLLKH